MNKHHEINNVSINNGFLSLEIDGQLFSSRLNKLSTVLSNASESALNIFEVSPSGYGIHWPLLDEDISIDGLLGVQHKSAHSQQTV